MTGKFYSRWLLSGGFSFTGIKRSLRYRLLGSEERVPVQRVSNGIVDVKNNFNMDIKIWDFSNHAAPTGLKNILLGYYLLYPPVAKVFYMVWHLAARGLLVLFFKIKINIQTLFYCFFLYRKIIIGNKKKSYGYI